MSIRKVLLGATLCFLVLSTLVPGNIFAAYNGSETWLHYSPVSDATLKAQYQSVCISLIISDPESDTLKNAQSEFDLAIPKLLGGSKLSNTDGPGAIVLAAEGSSLLPTGIDFSKINDEGFIIKSDGGKTYITGKNQVGVLRGVFHFLRLMQTHKPLTGLNINEAPYFPYRVLDHWTNHYGSNPTTERVYGGDRPYKMENFGNLPTAEKARIVDYCRMAVSLGLNGICPDNVNTYRGGSIGNYKCLEESNLKTQKIFADLIGTYGLKYYLSVSYASPRLVSPKMSTANAYANAQAKQWWFDKVDLIRKYIANFGGLLMKADSEGEEGPRSSYGLTQSQGANPMAEALKRHGHVLIWRTFIYDTSDPDFAVNQSKEFEGQTWNDAIILRKKDGPRDFQTVEPPNQLLTMNEVRHGMEFQITQEYTGQDIHLCWLVPKWKQILDFDMKLPTIPEGTEGSITYQLLRGTGNAATGGGVWAISNLSTATNWTGHFLAQANYYGYGRLAWNPTLSAEQIANEWISCSFENGNTPQVRYIVKDMLSKSWKTYEDYTISYSALMPALKNDEHYEIDFDGMSQSRFFTKFFMNLTNDGIGVDRTMETGNKMVQYYSPALADSFGTITKCPEDYLLFFHHCKWEYKMKSGMTLIQSLYHNHFRGIRQVRRFINNWRLVQDKIDTDIYSHVNTKLAKQLTDALRWVNDFKDDFGSKYGTTVGCDIGIVTPDTSKATVIPKGEEIKLAVLFKDQKGGAVTESFKWSSNGGQLSGTEGNEITFKADEDGIYEVTASTATFSELKDKIQIFVGDWWNPKIGVKRNILSQPTHMQIKISQNTHGINITTSTTGKIDIIGLHGRVVATYDIAKSGTNFFNTGAIAKGVYLIRFQNGLKNIHSKLILR
ncbi:MAG: hypothetical protein JW915_13490 [Chitinispirillaceae bacterium]|nr:hypothetical protein [Chitinispirillaceae bacterium]